MSAHSPAKRMPPGVQHAFDATPQAGNAFFARQLYDVETVRDALLADARESLSDAAERALRRSRKLGKVTRRTQVAGIVIGGLTRSNDEDPWERIHRAAALWRWGQP